MDKLVTTESRDGICIISFNRAEKRNAFTQGMYDQLAARLEAFENGPDRVAVLRAEGDHFCAGVDVNDPPTTMWRGVPGVGVHLTKPLLSSIQGWCVGAGATMVMMSDLAVAADDARFSFPEGRIGVFGGLTAGLVARIPQKIAIEFLMLGEPMLAPRAYEVGMVNRVVPRAELDAATLAMAGTLAGMAPKVLSSIKRWTAQTLPRAPAESFYAEVAVINDMAASEDFREGATAFRERRAPRFTGR